MSLMKYGPFSLLATVEVPYNPLLYVAEENVVAGRLFSGIGESLQKRLPQIRAMVTERATIELWTARIYVNNENLQALDQVGSLYVALPHLQYILEHSEHARLVPETSRITCYIRPDDGNPLQVQVKNSPQGFFMGQQSRPDFIWGVGSIFLVTR